MVSPIRDSQRWPVFVDPFGPFTVANVRRPTFASCCAEGSVRPIGRVPVAAGVRECGMSTALLPRGTVTFLFSDIEQSTDLMPRVGHDVFAAIRADDRRLLRDAFATHGGSEIDTAGDGFFVAFDSARAAVAAAVAAQHALVNFTWPADAEVHVRMGLHTAEPYLGDDGYVGVGVTRAARICDAARGDSDSHCQCDRRNRGGHGAA